MKTGAEIVAAVENYKEYTGEREAVIRDNWPTIRAALLAYKLPPSALRTIVDKAYVMGNPNFSREELAAARAELDELDKHKP